MNTILSRVWDIQFNRRSGAFLFTVWIWMIFKGCNAFPCVSRFCRKIPVQEPAVQTAESDLIVWYIRATAFIGLIAQNKKNLATKLDDDEEKLFEVWSQILEEAKKTAEYNSEFNYGVYQITKELNTSHVTGTGKSKKTVYDYPVLNGHLDTLRVMMKAYYKSHITNKMFKYELLK